MCIIIIIQLRLSNPKNFNAYIGNHLKSYKYINNSKHSTIESYF